ncbi:MAG: NADH-quinone oxidoreductase subunit C [Akkermansiaceae bacterium]|nr:NADH-quinone oxidoreductase subunit C [Akkermansiaceae bacterium]
MNAQEAARQVLEKFPSSTSLEFRGEHSVTVKLDELRAVMEFCREEMKLNFLLDASSVDNMGTEPRFEMVYELAKVDDSVHLRVKAPVPEGEEVPTVSDLWATADWHEREVYDMMGIRFAGHPDLRRILMWEGYPYHPLRKEFPLAGKPSEMPDVASSGVAPLADGPFVTSAGAGSRVKAEPRSRA